MTPLEAGSDPAQHGGLKRSLYSTRLTRLGHSASREAELRLSHVLLTSAVVVNPVANITAE